MAQKGNVAVNFFKSIYHNEFQWLANRNWIRSFQILYFPHHLFSSRSVVKSFGLFFLGVRIAKEFVGVEIMPAIQH